MFRHASCAALAGALVSAPAFAQSPRPFQIPIDLLAADVRADRTTPATAAAATKTAHHLKLTGFQADFHGNHVPAMKTPDGDASLPPAGQFGTFSTPGQPSRGVPSFFFGDGAALLNTVAATGTRPDRVVALDPILTSPAVLPQSANTYGFRIGHTLTSHAVAEFSFDRLQRPMNFSSDALNTIEGARAGWKAVFDNILGPNATPNRMDTATSTITNGQNTQSVMVGDASLNAGTYARLTPFVTFGGGVLLNKGTPAAFTVTGNTTFNFHNPGKASDGAPINQTDSVTVQYRLDTALIKMIGGGAEFLVTSRSGVRLDVRLILSPATYSVKVQTNPSNVLGTPLTTIDNGLNVPPVQFTNQANTPVTLLQQPVDFESFQATARQRVMLTTFAYFVRF